MSDELGIRFVIGDATAPEGDGAKIITHVCNDIGGWGAGFVVALSKRWKQPEREFRAWHRGGESAGFRLGAAQLVEVGPGLFVANIIGQRDIKRGRVGPAPVRYEAIREGLAKVRAFALERGASVHMPRIGCGLAGGDWTVVEAIVRDELVTHGVDVTVYDLA